MLFTGWLVFAKSLLRLRDSVLFDTVIKWPRNLWTTFLFPVPDCKPPCLNDTNVILAALTMETHLAPECTVTRCKEEWFTELEV